MLWQQVLDHERDKVATQLENFCVHSVPDFNPLGGSRPDAAVLGCAAVSLYTEGLGGNVIVAPDVLDTALAFLCAPITVTHAQDVFDLRAAFAEDCRPGCTGMPAQGKNSGV